MLALTVTRILVATAALCALGGGARADKGVVLDGKELRFARASLYHVPYGNVVLDLDLSARPMKCTDAPARDVDRGLAVTTSIHPGPNNSFFAGTTPFAIDIFVYAAGEQQATDGPHPRATLRLAPFKVKANAVMSGEIDIAGHGGGRFTTKLCPIKNVTLPVPPPTPGGAVTVTIDGKPWRPAKVLATRALVDKKPTVAQLWIVDADHTCESPTGPGSLSVEADSAALYPGTIQPARATITPPTGDASYAAGTSLAWLKLDLANGEVRGSFAARQDAARGSRWEASGTFTAELCPPR